MCNKNDGGAIQVLALAIIVIALVLGVIVTIVLGLDRLYANGTSNSFFSNESKIVEIRDNVRKKAADLREKADVLVESARSAAAKKQEDTSPPSPRASEGKTVDERLDAMSGRLNGGSP